jgi:signal transduction histidine kinase
MSDSPSERTDGGDPDVAPVADEVDTDGVPAADVIGGRDSTELGERPLRVLLVEDNPGDAKLIETHLDRVDDSQFGAGLSLSHVESLAVAMERLEDERFDVVLLDLGLPESTGIETAERVLEAFPRLPVVVLTGLQNREVAVEAIRAGAQDYLNKNEDIGGPMLARAIRYAVERKTREQQLERRTERLEEFASLISHELRNPLSIASGYATLAHDGETDPTTALSEIDDALDRMETLVDKLHRLTSLSSADAVAPVSVAAAAEESWADITAPAATLRTADGLPTIAADPTRIRSLFEQLFDNAVEHGSTSSRPGADDAVEHAGSEVTVEVGPLPEADGFYVADDGPGIPPEERRELFEHGSTGGTDPRFGLTIVRNVVDDHGWEIRVTESDAGGARFEISDLSNTLTDLRRRAAGIDLV